MVLFQVLGWEFFLGGRGGSKTHLLLSWHRRVVRRVLPLYRYCMNVKKRPLPKITQFFYHCASIAQLLNCALYLGNWYGQEMQELKVAIRFNLLHFALLFLHFSRTFQFHSFKVWKVLGLGFNAANQSSFHFPKSLFGDIAIICLWYIWGKFKLFQKTKALSTLISN